jgi:hypothetical protein
MKEELEEQKGRAESYLQQLRDGAKYVQTIQDQLDEVRHDAILILLYLLCIYCPLMCHGNENVDKSCYTIFRYRLTLHTPYSTPSVLCPSVSVSVCCAGQ